MTTTTRPMTVKELLELPDDGHRHELVRGELRRMAAAGNYHGEVAGYIAGTLIPHVRGNNLGKVYIAEPGFLLASNPDHVRVPDIGFVCRERIESIGRPKGIGPARPTWRWKSFRPATATPRWRIESPIGSPPERTWSSW